MALEVRRDEWKDGGEVRADEKVCNHGVKIQGELHTGAPDLTLSFNLSVSHLYSDLDCT